MRPWQIGRFGLTWVIGCCLAGVAGAEQAKTIKKPSAKVVDPTPLAGTEKLTWEDDIASHLVAGVDRFLLRKLEESIAARPAHWKRDFSSADRYAASVEPNRARLSKILGLRDPRVAFDDPELMATVGRSALVGRGAGFEVFAVRWPAFADVHGEGLLLVPTGKPPVADVVAIPDADQTPEQICGLAPGVAPESQFARSLAESGCRVLVPTLIDRELAARNNRAKLTNREYLYRSAFELGRHLIGYELQKVLAGVDWFAKKAGAADPKIGVIGWGEGGMLALFAGAVDPRIDAVLVSGYFDSRQNLWQEPIDRNLFGILYEFGDAELATLIAPRTLIVEAAKGPEVVVAPGNGGGPGRLVTPKLEDVRAELARARSLLVTVSQPPFQLVSMNNGTGPYCTAASLSAFVPALGGKLADDSRPIQPLGPLPDPKARLRRQMHELDRQSQWLLSESPYVRQQFMAKLDTSSIDKYQKSAESYRHLFAEEIIGRFDDKPLPFNARTRKSYDEQGFVGYDVVLDVFPDVIAYGVLLLPKDLKPGERRPVVVCQHGLEGRPQDVITGDHPAYHDFAGKLAERGFVTFAPQNLYLFTDRFRTLQRKANPIKKTLFSVMVPQHQQIVDWLKSLEFVDPKRIGFYGLSYGGKSAMRIPGLVTDYCLSICSADFNEWVWKNASTRAPYSYVWTPEYEIFEFDLGSTFNYAEMAALIAPRPFMVERGHFDAVAPDETVAYEFAKVRFLFAAKLGIADRCAIEWFVGPHTINGKGTFDFLHRHLAWPKR